MSTVLDPQAVRPEGLNAPENWEGPASDGHVVKAGELDLSHKVILYLDDISVSFDGFKALNKLNLAIDVGELRCIIGPNGAGKTTMMDVITGKTRPDSGKAFFGQTIDLTRMTEPEIAHAGIGRKFQKPTIFEHHTAFENLELAMKMDKRVWKSLFAALSDDEYDRVSSVLKQIRLDHEAERPAGLLSPGQKTGHSAAVRDRLRLQYRRHRHADRHAAESGVYEGVPGFYRQRGEFHAMDGLGAAGCSDHATAGIFVAHAQSELCRRIDDAAGRRMAS